MVLEKTLESPLDRKEIQPVHPKGDQSWVFFGRKIMTSLDSMLKSIDITLPTKVHLVKAMVFPVVTYGCESWSIKKAEHRGIDTFELWCWRRLLRVPWIAWTLFFGAPESPQMVTAAMKLKDAYSLEEKL